MRSILGVVGIAGLVTIASSGCGDDPLPPRSPLTPTLPGPVQPFVNRMTLTGPATVDLGGTASYLVTEHLSDGSTRDVTGQAAWTTNAALLAAAGPGQFKGQSRGETLLAARHAGRSATIGNVIVVPAGTYRLTGRVLDRGLAVPGAEVFIEDQGLGRTSLTSSLEGFKVFGVAGVTRVSVAKPGYQPTFRDLTVTDHTALTIDLSLSAPRPQVAGRYTVTFTAAPECSRLPEQGRMRSYPATVTQQDAEVTVTLEGDSFYTQLGRRFNRFAGTLFATEARFRLASYDPDYGFDDPPDIFDEVQDRTYYSVDGQIAVGVSSALLAGVVNGRIGVYTGQPPWVSGAPCASGGHRITFERR